MDKNNRDYSNDEITVHWHPGECIHSTICYTKLRKVFDPSRRPWINMQGSTTDKIIDIVKQCPTNALTFSRDKDKKENGAATEPQTKDNTKQDQNNSSAKVQIMKDGPTIISGDFIIRDIDGNKLTKVNTVALCRCGGSSNMPFCDGTHNKISFKEKR